MNTTAQHAERMVKTTLDIAANDMVRRGYLRQSVFASMVVYFIRRVMTAMDHANYDRLAIKAVLETIKLEVDKLIGEGVNHD